ncbi:cytochrome P450 3A17-like [Amphiura filiformis]|uniref:cytochrome P450 3A17-like n=1 Tax=Amphiura filiformis TaxID=82378 RepID=UPI003B219B82
MLIAEPELLANILHKDFKKFPNRRVYELKSCPFDTSLSQLEDPSEWYQTREMLSTVFNDNSLRRMYEHMNDNCSVLLKNVAGSINDNPLQLKRFFDAYSLDSIANSAFGLHLDTFHDTHHLFIHHSKQIQQSSAFSRPLFVTSMLPWMAPLFNYFNVGLFPTESMQYFRNTVEKSVESMSQIPLALQKHTLLNGVLEAHKRNVHHEENMQENGNNNDMKGIRHVNKAAEASPDQIMAQTLGFLLAGYETTSTALCLICYAIATHTSAQDELIKEIDQLEDNDSISYDAIMKMEYLDMVIKEALRLYPPTVVFDRVCSETVQYESITIPAGMTVCIPVWSIHRDSKYWTNPHKFNPHRFKSHITQCSYLPFGGGPRNCIAMEFVLLQIKLAILHLLRLYRLETCLETQVPPVLGSTGLLTPRDGVILKLVSRNSASRQV